MKVIEDKHELQEELAGWRHARERVAIVPTMGNLHMGHVSLVDVAKEHAERVVVTVFVNPTQFAAGEDFETYPRTFDKDTRRLRTVAADVLFKPSTETVYPFGIESATTVTVPGLTENFCGSSRPGHFDGVTTVVARLFALVRPDVAVFGQKDFQQQLVIKRMVEDLHLPMTIVTAPTIREDDGLAMSSRNNYLSDDEREKAPVLYQALVDVERQLRDGVGDFDALEQRARNKLERAGFLPEYVAVRRAADLGPPEEGCRELVVLAAANLGRARLIDNVLVAL
jgi:pantoate--beta-alanine ligase